MILKVLTGSRAYGLETPESDYDYHGVFVTPIYGEEDEVFDAA